MYSYVKKTYNLSALIVGLRVRHTVTGKTGEVRREDPGQAHYVMVRFDGQKHSLPCHPGELEFVAS